MNLFTKQTHKTDIKNKLMATKEETGAGGGRE